MDGMLHEFEKFGGKLVIYWQIYAFFHWTPQKLGVFNKEIARTFPRFKREKCSEKLGPIPAEMINPVQR